MWPFSSELPVHMQCVKKLYHISMVNWTWSLVILSSRIQLEFRLHMWSLGQSEIQGNFLGLM